MPDNENYTPATEESIAETGGLPRVQLSVENAESVNSPTDPSLSVSGMAADAKAVGDAIGGAREEIERIEDECDNNFVKLSGQTLTPAQVYQIQQNLGIVNLLYPVGSVYMSTSDTSPGTLFPNTNWQKIEGCFLIGTSETEGYDLGDTGGTKTATYTPTATIGSTTLTAAQSGLRGHSHNHTLKLPAHTHSFSPGSTTATLKTNTQLVQTSTRGVSIRYPSTTGTAATGYIEVETTGTTIGNSTPTECTGSISYVADQNATEGHTHEFVGQASTIQIMPPYLAVNMWKRVS